MAGEHRCGATASSVLPLVGVLQIMSQAMFVGIVDCSEEGKFMAKPNPAGDFLQFIIGGCLFGSGGFLLANQVMVRSSVTYSSYRSRYGGLGNGGGFAMPFGTPGMGLLMLPLALGVCLMFAGTYKRWANLLVWASLAALFVGVLNSLRMTFMATTLWQLAVYVVMIGAGGGLMFRSLNSYQPEPEARPDNFDVKKELEELRRRMDNRDTNS